jgi:hypothetical protein
MALLPCPECKKKISETAGQCPHCGYQLTADVIAKSKENQARSKKYAGIGCLGLIVLMIIISMLGKDSTDNKPPAVGSRAIDSPVAPPPVQEAPALELISWNWSESYGYAQAEGQVKNISGKSLKNIQAMVSWYTKDGEFITNADALLEYNPILPDQVSPFTVMTTHNPAMKKARIEFKTLFGGTVAYREKKKQK